MNRPVCGISLEVLCPFMGSARLWESAPIVGLDPVFESLPCKLALTGHLLSISFRQNQSQSRSFAEILKWIIEQCHEKTSLCHIRTTKVQINLRIRAV